MLTLHEALTPAEKIPARTESGAAKVEQYHRALFAVYVLMPISGRSSSGCFDRQGPAADLFVLHGHKIADDAVLDTRPDPLKSIP